jgi:hypothetical protein
MAHMPLLNVEIPGAAYTTRHKNPRSVTEINQLRLKFT